MKIIILASAFGLIWFFSCNQLAKKSEGKEALSKIGDSAHDTLNAGRQIDTPVEKKSKIFTPVFGFRFIVTGDFNGDGKKEKLTEHYFSRLNNKETNKFYDSLTDYSELIGLTVEKRPYCFVTSNNTLIDTLHISSSPQLLGLSYLKNEGDLNGDGTDEISYVVNWADWSNLNTWYIVTFKDHTWKQLYSFPIWDWQLPDLPETFNHYSLFGIENKVNINRAALNKKIERTFNAFKGLVKKSGSHKIRVIFRDEASKKDTMVIDPDRVSKKQK